MSLLLLVAINWDWFTVRTAQLLISCQFVAPSHQIYMNGLTSVVLSGTIKLLITICSHSHSQIHLLRKCTNNDALIGSLYCCVRKLPFCAAGLTIDARVFAQNLYFAPSEELFHNVTLSGTLDQKGKDAEWLVIRTHHTITSGKMSEYPLYIMRGAGFVMVHVVRENRAVLSAHPHDDCVTGAPGHQTEAEISPDTTEQFM